MMRPDTRVNYYDTRYQGCTMMKCGTMGALWMHYEGFIMNFLGCSLSDAVVQSGCSISYAVYQTVNAV